MKFKRESGSGIWEEMGIGLIKIFIGLENVRNGMLFLNFICDYIVIILIIYFIFFFVILVNDKIWIVFYFVFKILLI